MRIFENANINFIGNRKLWYLISGTVFLTAVLGIAIRGLQYGVDFKGGQEFVVQFQNAANVTQIRDVLTKSMKSQPEVKLYGSKTMILIRTEAKGTQTDVEDTINNTLKQSFPGNQANIVNSYLVGPRFADTLKRGALYSCITAVFVIFIYVWLRFRNWEYSTGAVVALVHDVTITLGLFTILDHHLPFNMDLDESLIAALLTIFGYSINDTVVVFDRIRENLHLFKTEPLDEIMNKSVNQTLSRTIITSGTTLFVVLVLFIFGGEVLKDLSFALLIGIVVGTYSSIFIASAIALDLQNWRASTYGKTKKAKASVR